MISGGLLSQDGPQSPQQPNSGPGSLDLSAGPESWYASIGEAVKPFGGTIGSTTGGQHNVGSLHGSGNAVDIPLGDWRNISPENQQAMIDRLSRQPGIKVRDERQRPAGQKVWGGPHLHVERATEAQAAPRPFSGIGRRPAKPAAAQGARQAPAGYEWNADRTALAPIPGGPAQAAMDAKAAATAAKQVAEEAKANAASVATSARQRAAYDSATSLINQVDELTKHPGFSELGTVTGDLKMGTPLIRSDVKDASASLKTIAGKIALTTMDQLRSLSASGATGFGALSGPELKLLENSISAL